MTAAPVPELASGVERELVEELTRAALTDQLPEELPVFEADRDAYLDARGTVAPPEHFKDEATGFGAEVLVLLTPYIIAAAVDAIHFVAGLFGDAIKDETKPQFASLVRRLFRLPEPTGTTTPAEDAAPVALAADTVMRVRDVVLTACRQRGLSPDDAALVSDAVAGRLLAPA